MYFSGKQTEDIKKLAQFKLLSLVQILHKVKLGELHKGMKNATDLWIAEANSYLQSRLSAKKQNPMSTAHKDILQFIKESVTSHRVKAQKQITATTDEQTVLKVKGVFKKLLSFELLFNSLGLLMMVPEMFEEIDNDL